MWVVYSPEDWKQPVTNLYPVLVIKINFNHGYITGKNEQFNKKHPISGNAYFFLFPTFNEIQKNNPISGYIWKTPGKEELVKLL